jgi:putative transposase
MPLISPRFFVVILNSMKKPEFTEEQIVFALKQGEAGQLISDVCRQDEDKRSNYYVWKKRYASMEPGSSGSCGSCAMRTLLKRPVADLTVDRHALQEVKKNLATPRSRQTMRCRVNASSITSYQPA